MDENINESQKERRIDRRDFLILIAKVVPAAVSAYLALVIHSLPNNPPEDELLKKVAVAMSEKGNNVQFTETGEFTREIFEKCRRGTFRFLSDNIRATCWLVQAENNSFIIATNKHVASCLDEKTIEIIQLYRPGIDQYPIHAVDATVSEITDNKDLALIKFRLDWGIPPQISNDDVLPWQDDYPLKVGQPLMIIGHPIAFHDPKNLSAYTMGDIVTVRKDRLAEFGDWHAKGLIGNGSSGSPAIIVENGQPKVVGIVFGFLPNVLGSDDGALIKKVRMIYGWKLEIAPRLKTLNV